MKKKRGRVRGFRFGSAVKDTCKLTPPSGPLWTLMNINYVPLCSSHSRVPAQLPIPLLPTTLSLDENKLDLSFHAFPFYSRRPPLKLGENPLPTIQFNWTSPRTTSTPWARFIIILGCIVLLHILPSYYFTEYMQRRRLRVVNFAFKCSVFFLQGVGVYLEDVYG